MIAELRDKVMSMVPGRRQYELRSPDADETRSSRAGSKKVYDGFDSDEEALKTMRRIWEEGRTRAYAHLRRCEINAMFFQGKQWAQFPDPAWSPAESLYQVTFPESGDNEVRTTANEIRKRLMGWVSRMTRNMPRVQWTPVSTDEDDKDRADILNKISQAEASKSAERRFIIDAFLCAGLWRSAFLLAYHDPAAGDMVHPLEGLGDGDLEMLADPEIGPQVFGDDYEPLSKMAGRPMSDEDMQPEGKICRKVIPSWAVTVINPHDTDWHEVPFAMYSEIHTRAWVKERYPDLDMDRLVSLDGESGWAHQLNFLQRTNEELIGALNGTEGASDNESGEPLDTFALVLVHWAWMRPTKSRKRGLCCITVGQQIAYRGDNPYWHGEIPLTHFIHTPDGRTLFGTCDFDDMVEPQCQLNMTLSQIMEHRNLAANPPRLDNQSGIDWENTLGVPGEVLMNMNGREPKYLQPADLPASTLNLVPELRFIIQDGFDDHTPTQGVSKPGDSGVKTRLLQQAGEVRLAVTAELFSEAYTEHWKQRMCLYAQYQERTKTGYVAGDMLDRQYFSWDRATLLGSKARGEVDVFTDENAGRAMVLSLKQQLDCQVTVQPGKSLTTVREDMANLQQLGVITPMNIQRYAPKLFDMYGYNLEAQDLLAEERRHASKASMENDTLERGGMLKPPHVRERHDIHIEVHSRFINSMRFERMDPMLQEAIEAHVQLHELALAQELIRQAYIAQAAQMQMMQQYGPLVAAPPAAGTPDGQPGQPGADAPPPAAPM